MRTVTMNVRETMDARKIRADVRHAVTLGALIGWQEIGPVARDTIEHLPGWDTYFGPGAAAAVPISWKTSVFDFLDAGYVRTTQGRARVTPSRYVVWVVLRHKKTGRTVARVNTHAVSGGWSKGIRPTTKWRRTQWRVHVRALQGVLLTLHRAGHLVLGGGDMNRSRVILMTSEKVVQDVPMSFRTHGRRLYDYLFHVADRHLRHISTHVVRDFFSDHDAVVGTYHIT